MKMCESSYQSERITSGAFCLTFDDCYFSSWEKAIPLFAKYDAHATFFIYGNIDDNALKTMKILQDAGHSVGLHSVNHPKLNEYLQEKSMAHYMENEILPQLEVCRKNNINIRAFAYPFSQRSAETDTELFKEFDLLRTSCACVKKNDDMPTAEIDDSFVKKVAPKQLFYGFCASGDFNMSDVKNAMRRAAAEGSVFATYAHDITENICPSHHMAVSQLVELLEYAKTIGLAARGFNEL